jgi:hypothetical protein
MSMKFKYLDDKLSLVVNGDKYDIRDCAKMILLITNGSITGYRNENLLESLLNGKLLIVGYHKKEKVRVCDGVIMYSFSFKDASEDAEKAARNHYNIIKENIHNMMRVNNYKIIKNE